MKEHSYVFRYIFIETDIFNEDYGTISESERERLYFDLMLGAGEFIENTGGLKKTRCGIGGRHGKTGWQVVFADYAYPDKSVHIFILLLKFPLNLGHDLSRKERSELRKLKEKADYYVGLYYERLKGNDSPV